MKLNGERPAGNGAAHTWGKWHWRAALQCLHDGDAVREAVVIGGILRFIGDPWVTEDVATAIEADDAP